MTSFCWVSSGPKINKYKLFGPSSFILTHVCYWAKLLFIQLNYDKHISFALFLLQLLPQGRHCHGPPVAGPTARGSRPWLWLFVFFGLCLFDCGLKSFTLLGLFIFQRLWSIMMVLLLILLKTLWRAFIWVSIHTINRGLLSPWSSSLKLHLLKLSSP